MLTPRPAALYGNFVVFLALVVVDLRLLEDSISIGSSSPPFDEVASLLEASLLEDDESTIQNKAIHVISVSDDKSWRAPCVSLCKNIVYDYRIKVNFYALLSISSSLVMENFLLDPELNLDMTMPPIK